MMQQYVIPGQVRNREPASRAHDRLCVPNSKEEQDMVHTTITPSADLIGVQ